MGLVLAPSSGKASLVAVFGSRRWTLYYIDQRRTAQLWLANGSASNLGPLLLDYRTLSNTLSNGLASPTFDPLTELTGGVEDLAVGGRYEIRWSSERQGGGGDEGEMEGDGRRWKKMEGDGRRWTG